MRQAYKSINDLRRYVKHLVEVDTDNLRKDRPPCFKEYNEEFESCKTCRVLEVCRKNTISVNPEDLKKFGVF